MNKIIIVIIIIIKETKWISLFIYFKNKLVLFFVIYVFLNVNIIV